MRQEQYGWSDRSEQVRNRTSVDRTISSDSRLKRALGYPYDAPDDGYCFHDGRIRALDPIHDVAVLSSRTPVLAIGSNRAPEQLRRKFRNLPPGQVIPVTSAVVTGFDVVHCATFSRYGAVPAMLYPSAGTRIRLHVTWLNDQQLTRMHETEGPENYHLGLLPNDSVICSLWGPISRIYVYWGWRPPLLMSSDALGQAGPLPAALAGPITVGGSRRAGPVLDQTAAQTFVRDRLAPDAPLDRFILQNIACSVTRAQRTGRLRAALGQV